MGLRISSQRNYALKYPSCPIIFLQRVVEANPDLTDRLTACPTVEIANHSYSDRKSVV